MSTIWNMTAGFSGSFLPVDVDYGVGVLVYGDVIIGRTREFGNKKCGHACVLDPV